MQMKKITPINRFIKSVEETPKWMIDNLHLKEGYRVGYTCVKSNIKSLFTKHNDLINIWTHLLGAIFFLIFFVYLLINTSYSKSLYHELKADIQELHITDKIQMSYNKNIEPLLKYLKNNSTQLDKFDWGMLKNNMIEKIKRTEEDYMEALNELMTKFKSQEIRLLKKFEIQYDATVKNLGILRNNLSNRIFEVSQISSDRLSDMVEYLDISLNTEFFMDKLRTAMQIDLEIYPVALFIISAIFCLGASAVYHTFYVMSPRIDKFLHRFDMAGINILIFGSVYTVLYYFFYCNPKIKAIYVTCCFLSCSAVFIASMGNYIHKPENVKLKGLMFASLGLSNAIPLGHVLYLGINASHENDNVPVNKVFLGLAMMGALYLIGLCFYVFKIPERFYPKTFDIWLNSHAIWHIFVFAAAVTHLFSVISLYSIRKSLPCSTWL